MYFDFIIKQILEYFVRNLLIYTALFFGEKYIIEYLTKKTIDSFVFNSNKTHTFVNLTHSNFFFTITSFIFYTLAFSMLILFLL